MARLNVDVYTLGGQLLCQHCHLHKLPCLEMLVAILWPNRRLLLLLIWRLMLLLLQVWLLHMIWLW